LANHYIDPNHPTLTSQQQLVAIESILVGGDVVWLQAGDHGPLTFSKTNATRVIVMGTTTGTKSRVRGGTKFAPTAKQWLVRYVDFHGVDPDPNTGDVSRMVDMFAGSQDCSVDRCRFYCEEDASAWTWTDWVVKPYMLAILNRGSRCHVTNCEFFNLRSGVSMGGDNGLCENNNLHHIGVDFIQVNGTWNRVRLNTLRNSMCTFGLPGSPEPLHGDFIQFYPATAPALNANNTVEFNDLDATGSLGNPMGISNFDGRPQNVKVLDNIVRVKTWNGIAMYGVDKVEIARNTVEALDPAAKAWIQVRASKTGVESTLINVHDNIMLGGATFSISPAGTPYS
jgi:hypothetical protein